MRFRCPFCMYIIKTSQSYKGQKMKCPSCEQAVVVPNSLVEEGCIIGDFVIRAKVGAGSIGTVYRADQISLERTVALKILSAEYTNAKGSTDFLKEARRAARLSHPNLVQALAVGEDNGICYMAMNYLSGETVKQKIQRENKIPVDEALHIVQQVAEALYYTWEQEGMIHRDVKPENIIITDAGVIKLTDMGLAMKTQEWSEDMEISGSPSYMSPEQFAGEPLDTQTDIYSLGITLYQMLSGELPFDGRTVRTVAKQHFSEVAISLSKKDSNIPTSVAKLVKKMIAKEKEDRVKSIEALLDRIWKIRQETAPNKSLVPDVHTISIKRLDYDIQKDSMERKRQEKRKKIEALRESSKFKYSVFVIPAVILIMFIVLLFVFRKDKETEAFKSHKEFFISKVDKGELSFATLEAEGRELLERYKGIKSDDGQKYLTEVRMALTQISNMRLSKKLERMEFRSNQLRVSLSAEKRKLENMTNAKKEPKKSDAVNKKLLAKLKKQQEEMDRLKQQVGTLAKKAKSLNKEKTHLIKTNNSNWKLSIDNKLFTILTTQKKGLRFFKANSLLNNELAIQTSKDSIAWLKKKKQLIATLKEIMSVFNKKLVGVTLPKKRRIDMVFVAERKLKINSPEGSKEIRWNKLDYDDMVFLIKTFKIKVDNSTLKQNILFLQGKIADAVEEKTIDNTLNDIIMAHFQKSIEEIKFNNLLNPRKSDKQVKQLLKSLSKVNKRSKLWEIKTQLEAILDK